MFEYDYSDRWSGNAKLSMSNISWTIMKTI